MSRIYVEVSLNIPVADGVLTYHLPEDMVPPLLGARVVVSVVGRRTIGYVVRVHEEKPEFRTVAVREVLDRVPLISETLFTLAQQISHDCACAIGEVLHCMLPAGIKQTINRLVSMGPKAADEGEPCREGLAWLAEKGTVPYSSFTDKFGISSHQAKRLIDRGLIEISYSLSEQQGPKLIKVLRITPNKQLRLYTMTPKERLVMEALMTYNAAPTAAALARKAGTSTAPINQLKRKGYIEEVEERVLRQVGTDAYYQRPVQTPPELSDDQARALEQISKAFETQKKPVLVRGVTCSGKTEIYLRWVAKILEMGRTAIVLVPEISLTPQMLKRFTDRFGSQVAILHSRLSEGERFDQWEQIRKGKLPVVVGARSAVFAPLPRLGTIILDEEGEPSFKQGESPRYHAREVALARCALEDAILIMGSATPTIDSFEKGLKGEYELVEISQRVGDKLPPKVLLVDMRQELMAKKNRSIFSELLNTELRRTLDNKKQAILYLNRRGFSSFVFCRECGEAVSCTQCKVSLVYHEGSKIMRCHYCGQLKEVPTKCPKCQSNKIKFFGAGTQRVEAEAQRYFPDARIQRLDSDSVTTKGSMEDILDRFGRREIDVLIGTQMVAKGLDFPDVTLVGVLAADSLLRVPDFRASERNFALLAQVAGRAGRGDTEGRVVLQTYSPEHHSIEHALTEDYHGFFAKEAKLRKEALFPPYVELAYFIFSSTREAIALKAGQDLRKLLLQCEGITNKNLFGPVPASIERINNRYRFQMMLKMKDFESLVSSVALCLKGIKKSQDLKIAVDINPFFMI
jgi:primosomal protein N' (replication factor Y)